ncbi:MAG: DUF192 domain-containing protein [Pseudomonadota bacterium]
MRNIIIATAVSGLLFSLATTSSFAADKKASSLRANAAKEYNASIDFVRTNIVILRKSMPKPKMDPDPPMLLQDESIIRPVPENIEPEDPALAFDVEIRDGMSLYNQSGWFNLSSYSEKSGVMMVFARPDTKPIIRSTQYAPVDILFIDKQGAITQIAPSINLSEIEEDIYPNAPILAYLFVKGGTCANMHINVGDEVQYSLFKKSPLILDSPPPKEPPPPANVKPPVIFEKF